GLRLFFSGRAGCLALLGLALELLLLLWLLAGLALSLRECVVRFGQSASPRWRWCRNECPTAIVAALAPQRHSAGWLSTSGAAGPAPPAGPRVQSRIRRRSALTCPWRTVSATRRAPAPAPGRDGRPPGGWF